MSRPGSGPGAPTSSATESTATPPPASRATSRFGAIARIILVYPVLQDRRLHAGDGHGDPARAAETIARRR